MKSNKQEVKSLLKDIRGWLSNFEGTTPKGLEAGDSGSDFESDAYQYFHRAIVILKKLEKHGIINAEALDLYSWLVELRKVHNALGMNEDIALLKTINELSELIKDANGKQKNN